MKEGLEFVEGLGKTEFTYREAYKDEETR